MFFWAFFFDYDSLSFFEIRQIINIGKVNKINPSGEIKMKGLLGIMRYPMYFVLIIYLWCQTLTMSSIVINIVLTVYIIIGTNVNSVYKSQVKIIFTYGHKNIYHISNSVHNYTYGSWHLTSIPFEIYEKKTAVIYSR